MPKTNGDPAPPAEEGAKTAPRASMRGEDAPFIGFEVIGATRAGGGLYTIALIASRVIPLDDGGAEGQAVCVGYLKGTEDAMLHLRKAIDDVLLLGQKTEGQAN